MNRRRFLDLSARTALGTLAGAGFLSASVAGYTCEVNRQTIAVAGLSPAFEGFRVAVLSDIHHSPWIRAEYIRNVVDMTNALRPDLIIHLGDYVHREGRKWAPGVMRELAALRAPYGVIGVLGNHDHYQQGQQAVREAMRSAGIHDLTNSSLTLQRDGEMLHLGGVGDYWKEKQDLRAAIGPARTPHSVILLSHNPDYAEEVGDERVGLILSGHTHGGQCVFPLLGAPFTSSKHGTKYLSGLCQAPATPVFVTRGVGSSYPNLRIGAPAEVSLLTLRREIHRGLNPQDT